jgi:hypothetical protein
MQIETVEIQAGVGIQKFDWPELALSEFVSGNENDSG